MPAPAVSVTASLPPRAVPWATVCEDGFPAPGHTLEIDRRGGHATSWQREPQL